MFSGLADPEDLLPKCRDPDARKMLTEAMACYSGGAYRACIVLTWTAVVFDYVAKLRDIARDAGSGEASTRLAAFEAAARSADPKASLRLEGEVLEDAKNVFQLLSEYEYADMRRLREDRNRCAHPSFHSIDEIYSPSAELARLHLRNTVLHMLARPPLQGAKRLERLKERIEANTFPRRRPEATAWMRAELDRPKQGLLTQLIGWLTSRVLESPSENTRMALAALVETQRDAVERAFQRGAWADAKVDKNVVLVCAAVPDLAWNSLKDSRRAELRRAVEQERIVDHLLAAARVPRLLEAVRVAAGAMLSEGEDRGGSDSSVQALRRRNLREYSRLVEGASRSELLDPFVERLPSDPHRFWTALAPEVLQNRELPWTESQKAALIDALKSDNLRTNWMFRVIVTNLLALVPPSDGFHASWAAFRDSLPEGNESVKDALDNVLAAPLAAASEDPRD